MFVYLGAILFLPSAFFALQRDNVSLLAANLMLWGAGFFFFGMGEWINHPPNRESRGGNSFFGPGIARVPHPGGLLLDAVGIVLLALGMWLTAVSVWRGLPGLFQ